MESPPSSWLSPPLCKSHMGLGSDDETLAELPGPDLASLDNPSPSISSSLSHAGIQSSVSLGLPWELQFMILDHMAIDHILNFRQLCKDYKQYIDTRVLYSYLARTTLHGLLRSLHDRIDDRFGRASAKFSHLENADGSKRDQKPLWDGEVAVFQLGGPWFEGYARHLADLLMIPDLDTFTQHHVYYSLNARPGYSQWDFKEPKWLLQLDKSVLDLCRQTADDFLKYTIDVPERTLRIYDWKSMLFGHLKAENSVRVMEARHGDTEDSIRAVRRMRFQEFLNTYSFHYSSELAAMRSMRSLFDHSEKNLGRDSPSFLLPDLGSTDSTIFEVETRPWESGVLDDREDKWMSRLLRWRRAVSGSQQEI